jgi:hypothetical protein
MLKADQSWGSIQSATGCSRATVAKIAKRLSVSGPATVGTGHSKSLISVQRRCCLTMRQ